MVMVIEVRDIYESLLRFTEHFASLADQCKGVDILQLVMFSKTGEKDAAGLMMNRHFSLFFFYWNVIKTQ